MKLSKQLIAVTLWEYRRFYKPKNELLGIAIMLVTFAVFFFIGKYAAADRKDNPPLALHHETDSLLAHMLSEKMEVFFIEHNNHNDYLQEIRDAEKGMILKHSENAFILYAWKEPKSLKQIESIIFDYQRNRNLESSGISGDIFNSIIEKPVFSEIYLFQKADKSRVVLAFVFGGLMILAVFLSFAYQFTAITGEKQLKITEQIVSAIKPQTWMDGKILGITLTGLSSMGTYTVLSILGGLLLMQITGSPLSSIFQFLHIPSIIIFLLFSIAGILIWNAVLAAIASVITDPNNSGKSSLMMLPALFVAASFLIVRDPDSTLSVFFSWFPFTSATAMPVRWTLGEASLWELPASFFLLVVTFYYLRKLAAKIFHISILISGKEPSWSEIFRWLK